MRDFQQYLGNLGTLEVLSPRAISMDKYNLGLKGSKVHATQDLVLELLIYTCKPQALIHFRSLQERIFYLLLYKKKLRLFNSFIQSIFL